MRVVGAIRQTLHLSLWVAALATPLVVSAQSTATARRDVTATQNEAGLPYVHCYVQSQYQGAAQSWVFEQDDQGVLYAGNNIGVLEFDGSSWRRIDVPGGSTVRALAHDGHGRIYVGTSGDFGYLDEDRNGRIRYVSLLPLVPEDQREFNDIWAIHATEDGTYFLARERLFRLNGGAGGGESTTGVPIARSDSVITSWTPEVRFLYSFWHDGTYYVHQGEVGLMRIRGDSLELVPGGQQFADERVQVMLPRPNDEPGFVLGSFNGGLFTFDGKGFSVFRSDINASIQANTLYKGVALPNGAYALATLDGGVVITDDRGQQAQVLDLSLGLPSNSILATFVDREGALWFSPENGICRVDIASPLSYYDATNGLIGGVLDVVRHQGKVYAAASNGTFILDARSKSFRPVSGWGRGNPQSFKLLPFGDLLLVASGTGVYSIDGDKATLLKDNTGGSFAPTGLHRSRLADDLVFAGLIDGVGVMRVSANGRLQSHARLEGIRQEAWTFTEPQPGTLWIGSRAEGAYRITYSADLSDINIENFAAEQGLPVGNVMVFQAAGQIVAATKVGVFAFDENTMRFDRDPELDVVDFDGSQEEFFIAEAPNGDVWVAANREAAIVRKQADGSFIPEVTPILHISDVAGAVIYPEDDGTVWFGGTESLLRFDPSVGKSYSADYSALVRMVTIRDDSILFSGAHVDSPPGTGPQLKYIDNAMRFHYAAPTFERPSETRFQSMLEGFDDRWSNWTTDNRRDYTNLPFGEYAFRVHALNVYGRQSKEASFAFTILPPWYRTWWSYLLYALALGTTLFGVDRLQRRRLSSKERERAHLREAELRAESAEAEANNVELLSRIGKEITATLSFDQIVDRVYESVNDLMDASFFGIGIHNVEEERLDFVGSKEKGQTLEPYFYRLEDDRLASWCFNEQKEIIIQDYARDHTKYLRQDQPAISGEVPESVLYLPLVHKEKVIGVISAQSFEKNAYTDYHLNILRNLATYTAIALDNAEAYLRLNKTFEDLQAAQTRLVQSEKMASLGQLTAGIAHEIKNPLNFVNNFAAVSSELTDELIEEIDKNMDKQLAEVAEELREILADLKINSEMINEHGKRADGIVKSMLQHSRGDSGEQTATDVNVLLEEYVNLAYHGMRAADPDFNSSIEKAYDESAGTVTIVPQDIGRVLINLLNNAFYAVNERAKGGEEGYAPTVSVHTKRTNTSVEVGVRDNGTGIPDSVKAKIFEPFYTTKPTGSGTGLGLSMSYDIIAKGHGGDLKVDSKPGEFTQFVIVLPA